jgi:hypothetical protein
MPKKQRKILNILLFWYKKQSATQMIKNCFLFDN